MVATTFEAYLPSLFDVEGGWSDRDTKADPGGPTNHGITLETLRAWRGDPGLSKEVLRAMPKAEAVEIYKAQYWAPVRGDELPAGVDLAVFDFAVNSGPGRAVKELQEVLGVKQDGIIGLQTLDAVHRYPGKEQTLISDYADGRLAFMKGLSNWPHNKNGWTNRVNRVKTEAQTMVFASANYRPDMSPVSETPKALAANLSVSKALASKETASLLTVAIPSISGLVMDSAAIQYAVALFIAGFGAFAIYWSFKRLKKAEI